MKRTNETSQAGADLTLMPFNADRVEHRISPMFANVITLPVIVNGRDTGVACYVGAGSFSNQVSDAELIAMARKILEAVNEPTPKGAGQFRAMFRAAFEAGFVAGLDDCGASLEGRPDRAFRCGQAFDLFAANVAGGAKVGARG